MAANQLHAPWRIEYLKSIGKSPSNGCFICEAAAASTPQQQHQSLLLWKTPMTVVVINRFPYTNGHLLVAPVVHKAELEELGTDEMMDLQSQTVEAVRLLRRAVSAQGFNIGINLGRCAGAGLPGHVHQHVVPRWAGDTNFMQVIGETQVVPQAMSKLWEELLKVRQVMLAEAAKGT